VEVESAVVENMAKGWTKRVQGVVEAVSSCKQKEGLAIKVDNFTRVPAGGLEAMACGFSCGWVPLWMAGGPRGG
jgi:hypothetical protein